MKRSYPIYTLDNECQDCYKCVRRCPVKAIKVMNDHASVVPELCVGCGRCFEICPPEAKQFRNDLSLLDKIFTTDEPVYVSLAPSWVNEFNGVSDAQICAAFRELGFTGVSETALGAQVVSAEVARQLDEMTKGVMISSACPAVVDYVCKYLPDFAPSITQIASPAMAHARILKKEYPNSRIVFVGPCIAKKNESDRHPETLDLSLTFIEFRQLLTKNKIDLAKIKPNDKDKFVLQKANEGALYPIEGGMIDTIKPQCHNKEVQYATITGLENLELALTGLKPEKIEELVFLEVLACSGGCVHGPCTEHKSPGLLERIRVLNRVTPEAFSPVKKKKASDIELEFTADAQKLGEYNPMEITEAMRSVGKVSIADELNCGGCGYDSCREFAEAMVAKRAEPAMCVSYMRKQAQKQANALLRCIPSGVVIVNKNLEIIECNRYFAESFGEETLAAYDASPGMAGADISRIVPFSHLFKVSLDSGQDIQRDSYHDGDRLFNITVFNIEPHEVAGAVIFDVTKTEMRREEIAKRARKVIDKNLVAVQEIAFRLGEHMADTELILRSIADDYADNSSSATEGEET